jgi:hypothetical protein
MGRFETQWLAAPKNFAVFADLSGRDASLGFIWRIEVESAKKTKQTAVAAGRQR